MLKGLTARTAPHSAGAKAISPFIERVRMQWMATETPEMMQTIARYRITLLPPTTQLTMTITSFTSPKPHFETR